MSLLIMRSLRKKRRSKVKQFIGLLLLFSTTAWSESDIRCRTITECPTENVCSGYLPPGEIGFEVWSDPEPFTEVLGICVPVKLNAKGNLTSEVSGE
jgi:hypothetical protein